MSIGYRRHNGKLLIGKMSSYLGMILRLKRVHLIKSRELDNLITEFKGEGDNVVAAIRKNSYKDRKLKINRTQYFEVIEAHGGWPIR
ncbi:MAG: hypothetical protein WAV32_02165 [Halobacteriota archaeon]